MHMIVNKDFLYDITPLDGKNYMNSPIIFEIKIMNNSDILFSSSNFKMSSLGKGVFSFTE